jgi:tetratricopeptide (TPR) repeat protein
MTARPAAAEARNGSPGGGTFVGRERELAALHVALDDALAGRGRLVLVVGEPGIGKTRTVEHLAAEAARRGCEVLVGRCYEGEGAPVFWPWIQVIRSYIEGRDADTLRADVGPQAADVADVVRELRERLPDLPTSPALGPEQARFRLFESVTTLLRNAARRRPLALVFDDLHWADRDSLMLLSFLAQDMRQARLLVLGTYRDTEVGRYHPLAETLGDLARHPVYERIRLGGLDERDVARFLELATGTHPLPALVAAAYRQTEGNPLFLAELTRLLVSEGSPRPELLSGRVVIPQGVREVIGRRLGRLSPECSRVLLVAAVVGREFDVKLVERVLGLPATKLLEVLEEAVALGIVTEERASVGRYRFAHALIRETLYDAMPIPRRVHVHGQMGRALEALYARRLESHLDELAHHFFQSAGERNVGRAVGYAMQAARRATALHAHEEAAAHYGRALEVLEVASSPDRYRAEILLALGESQARAGDPDRARTTFREAAELARGTRDAEQLACAALGFGGPLVVLGMVDPTTVALLEEALALLPPGDGVLRARVLGRLAMELCYSDSRERRAALTEEAVAMARRLGDGPTLTYALTARRDHLWRTEHVHERLADADELLRRAADAGDLEVTLDARHWRILDLFELGDVRALDAELERFAELAHEVRHPVYVYRTLQNRATRALLAGRFDEAEAFAAQYMTLRQRVSLQYAAAGLGAQVAAQRRVRGPLTELEAMGKRFAEQFPGVAAWRCGLVVLYAELGREAEARREFERLAANDFTDIQENLLWVGAVAFLAEATAALGDARRAELLYPMLLPYAGRNIVIGLAVDCWGAASRFLGLLATTMRRWEDAERHFSEAFEMNARMGASSFVALTQHAWATMLLVRGASGDAERARGLLADALRTARELGMPLLAEKILALDPVVETARGGGATPPVVGGPRRALFRREGEYWTIGDDATACRLKDSIGLRCLAVLLRTPDREHAALDLAAAARDRAEETRSLTGDAGEMLDRRAREAYRAHLEGLRGELEEANAFGDGARSDRLQAEIDALARELARALGFGGRDRRAASSAERARVNVTRVIRDAVRRIAAHHAPLGRHLATAVRTGTFCSYEPAALDQVRWIF